MGVAGRELAQARYSWGSIGRRLVEIYQSLVVPARA
jgi:glycosyltransferase involved in cell wall biosynthesis